MRQKRTIPIETLTELLSYDPESGRLFWKTRDVSRFPNLRSACVWNARYGGNEAFTAVLPGKRHYRVGNIFNVGFRSHRVAWALMTGEWPALDIDHINGDGLDNRWCNLRLATHSENMRNARKATVTKTSRFKGVCWYARDKRWVAEARISGARTRIGYFHSEEEAARAYDAHVLATHGRFARLNFPA